MVGPWDVIVYQRMHDMFRNLSCIPSYETILDIVSA